MLKVISRSTFDLRTVLQTLVESAARFCNADKTTIIREKDGLFFTLIGSGLFELIRGAGLIAYPDDGIHLAISRAVVKENARGLQITKEKSSHKIDVVVALAMACHACVQQQNAPKPPPIVQPGVWSKNYGWLSDPVPNNAKSTTARFYEYYNGGGGSCWPGSGPREW